MKIVKMDVQVCVPDCVTDLIVRDTAMHALLSCVGVHAVEVGMSSEGENVAAAMGSQEAARSGKCRTEPAQAGKPKRRVVDNGDGTVTETRR